MNRSTNIAVLILLLLFTLACGKKSNNETSEPQTTPGNQAAQTPAPQAEQQTPQGTLASEKTPEAPPPPKPEPLVVPAGTTLTIRLGTALSSHSAKPGQTFPGTVANAVTVAGGTAIPAGSAASGTVQDAKKQGTFKGEGVLALALTTITVKGTPYSISTNTFAQEVKGKGKRTAKSIGGVAAGGALIGGIAGGGKGAAIGALAGAGAGTAVAGATGGENVNLPAEAMITFKLTAPLTIQP